DAPERTFRIQRLHLETPPPAGCADDRSLREILKSFPQKQHISRILSPAICENRKVLPLLHGHILQAVYGKVDPALRKRTVKLFDEQPFPSDLLQAFIEDFIPGGLHGNDL